MSESLPDALLESDLNYCARHPERDTELRCNRCERYMCVDCARRTPIGYTCHQCVRGHEDKFFAGTTLDYLIVAAMSAIGGAIAAALSLFIGGFILLGIVIAPAIGGFVAQIALQLTGRRRGRQSAYVCAGALLCGGLAFALVLGGLGVFTLIYLGLAASAAYARFKVAI